MRLLKLFTAAFATAMMLSCSTSSQRVVDEIRISPKSGDITVELRNALESTNSKCVKIVLQEGEYYVTPEYAFEKYCAVTNHNNGTKKIVFPFEKFESVKIEGNGATIMCDGQLFPFLFENCAEVEVRNLTIDWVRPFLFYGEVTAVNPQEGWREIKPLSEQGSWSVKGNVISFPNSHGFNYTTLGATLPFDAQTKGVVDGALDHNSGDLRIEKMPNGNLRFHETMKRYPPIGSILNSKGDKKLNRYAPAFNFKECQNITIDNVTVHHALGMGFLFERSEDITILNSNVILPPNSSRVVSTTADATHFANCKGNILIDNCTFENMLDDGTNVHGTYLEVVDILDEYSVNLSLMHFQQLGFKFAEAGDEMWFIQSPSPERRSEGKVSKVRVLNETIMTLTFDSPLPQGLKPGDCIENKRWNPTFTIRNSTIRNNRARGLVVKSPLKTVIEGNTLTTMMSAILLRGETYSWFESGAVEDVLIQNNIIKNSANCGEEHAALYITPRLGASFDNSAIYDRNIRFVNNTIDCFNPRVVIADRVENLLIEGNKIIRNTDATASFPDAPLFELVNCKDVTITGNSYTGATPTNVLQTDVTSRSTLVIKDNNDINF